MSTFLNKIIYIILLIIIGYFIIYIQFNLWDRYLFELYAPNFILIFIYIVIIKLKNPYIKFVLFMLSELCVLYNFSTNNLGLYMFLLAFIYLILNKISDRLLLRNNFFKYNNTDTDINIYIFALPIFILSLYIRIINILLMGLHDITFNSLKYILYGSLMDILCIILGYLIILPFKYRIKSIKLF